MHTRDYSEDTSRVIDAEVERILRDQEERALEVLSRHRGGLDAVARALLDEETIDGATVGQLVDTAYGKPVHEHGVKAIPPVFVAEQHGRPTGDSGGAGDSGAEQAGVNGSADARTGSAANGDGSDTDADSGSEVESEVAGSSHASGQSGTGQSGNGQSGNGQSGTGQQDNGQGSAQPWPPPPPPPPGHWPQAPAPWPAQPAPGQWPHQAPWPPPPPPPPSNRR
jgi:hypothetical protein